MVPDNREVKNLIFHDLHDASYAGHPGVRKTVMNIPQYFTWPKIWAETESYVKYCTSCQVNKGNNTKPPRLLQPNDTPPNPWHTITTDYVTGFPKIVAKYNAVAVFVDSLTKYVLLVPCSKESSGADWAHMFVDNVHEHFGLPVHVLSDIGTQFTGLFNHSLAERLGSS